MMELNGACVFVANMAMLICGAHGCWIVLDRSAPDGFIRIFMLKLAVNRTSQLPVQDFEFFRTCTRDTWFYQSLHSADQDV